MLKMILLGCKDETYTTISANNKMVNNSITFVVN